MNKKRQILLSNIFLLFLSTQIIAQQFFAQQMISDRVDISKTTMQSSTHAIDLGSLISTESILLMKSKITFVQNILYAGLSRKFAALNVHNSENEDESCLGKYMNFSLFDMQKLKNIIVMSFLLCSFGSKLMSADQVEVYVQQPIAPAHLECIPRHVQALPMTFTTNLAGNGVANCIGICSPDPLTAGVVACLLGCVGGGLESFSSDTKYMSQDFIDVHRNFKTGFVADQLCVPVSTCFKTKIPNAAAVGAPIGYVAGLGAGLIVHNCLEQRAINNHVSDSVGQVHHNPMLVSYENRQQVPSIEIIERN